MGIVRERKVLIVDQEILNTFSGLTIQSFNSQVPCNIDYFFKDCTFFDPTVILLNNANKEIERVYRFENCILNQSIYCSGNVRIFFEDCTFVKDCTFENLTCTTFQLTRPKLLNKVEFRDCAFKLFYIEAIENCHIIFQNSNFDFFTLSSKSLENVPTAKVIGSFNIVRIEKIDVGNLNLNGNCSRLVRTIIFKLWNFLLTDKFS